MQFNIDQQEFIFRQQILEQEFNIRELAQTPTLEAVYAQLLMQAKPNKDTIFWITISPPDGETLKFINKCHTLTERSYLPNIAYTFEQRGESNETMGNGVHCHIVADHKKGIAPKQIINNLASLFKLSHTSIDVKKYPAHYRPDKIQYLLGNKYDEEKNSKLIMDIEFRKKYNLNKIYQ